MSAAVSPSSGRPYGLVAICRVWNIRRATLYRRRTSMEVKPALRRRGPTGPMPDAELVERIRAIITASPFHGEGYRKVWARLRVVGVRTSRRRTLRLMRENDLLAPSRTGAPKGPRNHDGTIIPDAIDIMWGTDMTTIWTQGGQSAVFIAIDHHSGECTGIHAARRGTRFEALEPIRQGVRRCFGAFAEKVATGLSLRHDHGSQYMSDDFQNEIRFLGIESSPMTAADGRDLRATSLRPAITSAWLIFSGKPCRATPKTSGKRCPSTKTPQAAGSKQCLRAARSKLRSGIRASPICAAARMSDRLVTAAQGPPIQRP